MNIPTSKKQPIGDCEVCDKTGVEIWNTRGNINMCVDCNAENNLVIEQAIAGNQVIQQMKQVDEKIETKADLFNASTVAIVQIKGAIWADSSIPDNKKQYAYTKVCADHFEKTQKAVFEMRQELLKTENEMRAWQVAAQTAAGQLTIAERENFKKLNVSYSPTPVKNIKPSNKGSKPTRSYAGQKGELNEAAAKYNVAAALIRMTVLQRNVSADEAGRIVAEQLSKAKLARESATK